MIEPMNLGEQMKSLEHVQELDLKIDRLQNQKNSLPGLLKVLDDSLVAVRNSSEAKKRTMAELEKNHRQAQAALDLNNDRLTRANSKLESVQNSQEFQAATKEIDQLKKLQTTLEEQLKNTYAEINDMQAEVETLDKKLSETEAERNQKAETVSSQSGEFEGQISTLNIERKKFADLVQPQILARYNRVRGARAGLGIVPAVGGRCKGCNMMLPPQLFNLVQKGIEVQSCPSCHRILFIPSAEVSTQQTSAT